MSCLLSSLSIPIPPFPKVLSYRLILVLLTSLSVPSASLAGPYLYSCYPAFSQKFQPCFMAKIKALGSEHLHHQSTDVKQV